MTTTRQNELNVAVAEVRGWRRVKNLDIPSKSFSGARSNLVHGWSHPIKGVGYGDFEPPNYTGSLDACKELLEEIQETRAVLRIHSQKGRILIHIYSHGGMSMPVPEWTSAAPTLELAIVEAYLRWKGKWKEEWN